MCTVFGWKGKNISAYHIILQKLYNAGGCFTNVLQALQNILSKSVYCKNRTSYVNFKLKLCMSAQSHALDMRTNLSFRLKFWPEMWFMALYIFARLFWNACKTLVKQAPGSCNSFLRKTRTCMCCIINFMADDGLATSVARPSSGMILIWFEQVYLAAAQRGLMWVMNVSVSRVNNCTENMVVMIQN